MYTVKDEFAQRLLDTLIGLVACPSLCGTSDENTAVDYMQQVFEGMPYFQENPKNLLVHEIPGDRLKRTYLTAFYQSPHSTADTVVLTGHHDVVEVDCYGILKDLAFDAKKLTSQIHKLSLNDQAKADLASGDYLFGRGILDMKYGLALFIELMRDYSGEGFPLNILFLSVPGEETNSEGMLEALKFLAKKQEEGLNYVGLILGEPSSRGNDKEPKAVELGASGKMNLLYFCVGVVSHVNEAFNGLNVSSLLAAIQSRMELNLDFCESSHGQRTIPPSSLKMSDLKKRYSVTTPLYGAAYYNIEILENSFNHILGLAKDLAQEAIQEVMDRYHRTVQSYSGNGKRDLVAVDTTPVVMTYQQLFLRTKAATVNLEEKMNEAVKAWREEGMDNQSQAIALVELLCDLDPDKSPRVVIGIIPPYYPARYPDVERNDYKKFFGAMQEMIQAAQKHYHLDIEQQAYCGVSDFSFIEAGDVEGMEVAMENLIGRDLVYGFPMEALLSLHIPGVVFGSCGREIHQAGERIYLPYCLDIHPDLTRKFLNALVKKLKKV